MKSTPIPRRAGLSLLVLAFSLAAGNAVGQVDPRGPISYAGTDVAIDAQGIHASGFSYHDLGAKPAPWQARWIWTGSGEPSVAMFRKEVLLSEKPQSVTAWLTADAKYRLYVNGRLVSRGPVDQGRDYFGGGTNHWFYDVRDLTPYLTEGRNVIAAEVFREWPINFTVSHAPGFLFEAEIISGGRRTTTASDASWRSMPAAQFPDSSTYEAAKEPEGWRMPGFDDSAWLASREVKDVWEPLVPSEIPPLMEARYPVLRYEGLPADRTFTRDGTFRVVFDRVLSAYPTLKIKGGKGALATIKGAHEARMMLGGGQQYFEFPYMTEVVPAYTVTLTHVTDPVVIEDAGANFTSQPVDYKGAFECSDTNLNAIWDVSRWAVQICLQTHHLDSPNHQEPISDPGDYVIEDMVNNYAFAQPWMARQDIRKFAWLLKDERYHNFHTSYSISWLQMLMDYYRFTGDRSLVEEMAPYVRELMATYASWIGKNGILSEAPNYMFMDWVTIGGFPCHHPPSVIGQGYLTAFYYHGLDMATQVAALVGDTASAEAYIRQRGEIAEAFNRELWVPAKGLYRDGKPFVTSVKPYQWLPADKDIETFSPHVNMLAVLFDLAPKERQKGIVDSVMSEEPLNTQPWFMYWIFQAIDHAGSFERYGTPQLRRWQCLPETHSFREMWTSGDLSHGWCSTPLVEMSSRILGVFPASPGFDTVAIRPQPCDLSWAKGRVPTPHGEVSVEWVINRGTLALDVGVPTGTDAEVTLPVSRFIHPRITLDGREVGDSSRVSSGRYHFEVTGEPR
jgi:hypothetical protein